MKFIYLICIERGLKTIDVILNNYQNYQNEDIDNLLSGVKQKLITKLYFLLWNSHEGEILFATSKLLGKLGHYPRTLKMSQKFKPLGVSDPSAGVGMTLVEKNGNVEINFSLVEAIRMAVDVIDQYFEAKLLVPIKVNCVESAWVFLQSVAQKLIENKIDAEALKAAVLNSSLILFH